jgi:hypothetical protein
MASANVGAVLACKAHTAKKSLKVRMVHSSKTSSSSFFCMGLVRVNPNPKTLSNNAFFMTRVRILQQMKSTVYGPVVQQRAYTFHTSGFLMVTADK